MTQTPRQLLDVSGESMPVRMLLAETWHHRGLIQILARKDFFVRYRRASFGLVWAVALPALQATVLSVVFSRVLPVHTGTSYPVFVLTGLLVWTFFSTTVQSASTSVVEGAGLSSKIYFPRLILPLVTVGSNLYGLVISLGILLAAALLFGVGLGVHTLLLVPALALLVLFTAMLSALLAALHVYSRDVRYLVQAVFTALFYLTPVIYPLRKAPHSLRPFLALNPVTGIVELARRGTAGADPSLWGPLAITLGWTLAVTVATVVIYARRQRVFVDLL